VAFDLEAIKKRGFINVLVDNNSFSYFIYKGRPMGYEYELLNLLAKKLKVDLKIKVISGVEKAIEQLNPYTGASVTLVHEHYRLKKYSVSASTQSPSRDSAVTRIFFQANELNDDHT
jgi:membrane-bound lytic murein transglycosylase MltF